jgi:hypothetical protein
LGKFGHGENGLGLDRAERFPGLELCDREAADF